MRIKRAFVCAASAIFLSGCYTAMATVATVGMDKSKYSPILITKSDVDAWEAAAREVNRQVVRDELGTYYFDVKPEGIYQSYITAKDGEVLRNLFSGEIGLLEPVYVQNDNLSIRPDWKETERRHDYLTRTIKLKLLPLSASRKYHELIEKKVRADGINVSISDAFTGNHGLYDSKFYAAVVQEVPGKFSYFISSTFGAGNYYFNLQSQLVERTAQGQSGNSRLRDSRTKSENRSQNQGPMAYRGATRMIRTGYGLHFAVVETFRDMRSGGTSYLAVSSRCGFINPDEQRKVIEANAESSNIPYVSGINMALKERDPEELRRAKAEYFQARTEAKAILRRHEVACLGLREIGVAGRIGSQKLD